MVAAYHLIWTIYGYWLPNDPRGSMSHSIYSERIAELGAAHFGRKRLQPEAYEIDAFRRLAAERLKHDLRMFSDDEITVVGAAFGRAIAEHGYTCYACAVMPDHVHLVIRKHRHRSETMIENLQTISRKALIESGRFPKSHPVWGGPGWWPFLNTQNDIRRVIRYVEENPIKARRPAQTWEFVKAYDGWLPGIRRDPPA